MADEKYITLSEKALDLLLGSVRESHSVAEGIDDENIATNSTYSSVKLQELLKNAGVQAVELTKAEYDALSEEEKNSETIYFISDGVIDSDVKEVYSKAEINQIVSTFWDGDPIAFDETTIAAETGVTIAKDITKDGYVPVLPSLRSLGSPNCTYSGLVIDGTTLKLAIRNNSTNEVTVTPSAYVLYRKEV